MKPVLREERLVFFCIEKGKPLKTYIGRVLYFLSLNVQRYIGAVVIIVGSCGTWYFLFYQPRLSKDYNEYVIAIEINDKSNGRNLISNIIQQIELKLNNKKPFGHSIAILNFTQKDEQTQLYRRKYNSGLVPYNIPMKEVAPGRNDPGSCSLLGRILSKNGRQRILLADENNIQAEGKEEIKQAIREIGYSHFVLEWEDRDTYFIESIEPWLDIGCIKQVEQEEKFTHSRQIVRNHIQDLFNQKKNDKNHLQDLIENYDPAYFRLFKRSLSLLSDGLSFRQRLNQNVLRYMEHQHQDLSWWYTKAIFNHLWKTIVYNLGDKIDKNLYDFSKPEKTYFENRYKIERDLSVALKHHDLENCLQSGSHEFEKDLYQSGLLPTVICYFSSKKSLKNTHFYFISSFSEAYTITEDLDRQLKDFALRLGTGSLVHFTALKQIEESQKELDHFIRLFSQLTKYHHLFDLRLDLSCYDKPVYNNLIGEENMRKLHRFAEKHLVRMKGIRTNSQYG